MSSQQVGIHFDEATHTYTRLGKKYTSCTTVTGKYKKPFNRRFWAMYSTLKETFGYRVRANDDLELITVNGTTHGINELYSVEIYREAAKMMKNGWDDTTKVACDRGNKIHDGLEGSINKSKFDVNATTNSQISPFTGETKVVYKTQHDLDSTNLQTIYPDIYNVLLKYINQGCTIYAEKKVYMDEFEISGMIDCLVVKGNKFIIIDWKTNKDIIHFRSGYYKKEKVGNKYIKSSQWINKPSYLLYPLNHLEDSKGNLYTLQVSLYAYMVESWGYELLPNGLFIFHIRPNSRPERIAVPYFKEDIETMLNHFKEVA